MIELVLHWTLEVNLLRDPANSSPDDCSCGNLSYCAICSTSMAPPAPQNMMRRIKEAAKRLKQSVLALYYAVQHPEVSIWPKLIAAVALTYALR